MSAKKYAIYLEVDHDDDSKDQMILEIIRNAAQGMLASAMLLQDKRPPKCAIESDDLFEGVERHELVADQATFVLGNLLNTQVTQEVTDENRAV